jgi:orotidine-5'-phosphate decarboxylase
MSGLGAAQRIILSVDTFDLNEAAAFVKIAKQAGAKYVKFGLQLSSATSWQSCSKLAANEGLEWIADAKLDDIPNTVRAAVTGLKNLDYPPFGITMHTTAGHEAMKLAQAEAGDIIMFGVTVLTSLSTDEVRQIYSSSIEDKVLQLAEAAAQAGVRGVVASPQEVKAIKSNRQTQGLVAMIPGTRSQGTSSDDQARVTTPAAAIKAGADLLVIGRQITQANSPVEAYNQLVKEVAAVLEVSE